MGLVAFPECGGFVPFRPCRFFIQISLDAVMEDQPQHSISFISDANVLALHRLLWTHQERIGEHLAKSTKETGDPKAKCRPYEKLATLLAYLGPPEHKPLDSQ